MRAEAVAEAGGRIVAVGSRADVMKHHGPQTQLIDLQGRTLLPGFVDAHGHMMVGGLQALAANLLAPPDGEVTDIASAAAHAARLDRRQRRRRSSEVKLIVGFGYDDSQLTERRHPNARRPGRGLDATYPILLVHQSGHLGGAQLQGARDRRTSSAATHGPGGRRDPPRREGSQEPNGVLEETAFFAADRQAPRAGRARRA